MAFKQSFVISTVDSNESFTLINQRLSRDDSAGANAQQVSAKRKSSEASSIWSSEFWLSAERRKIFLIVCVHSSCKENNLNLTLIIIQINLKEMSFLLNKTSYPIHQNNAMQWFQNNAMQCCGEGNMMILMQCYQNCMNSQVFCEYYYLTPKPIK